MSASSDRVGDYVLEKSLGQGGHGRVFVARKAPESKPVALKLARRASRDVNASLRREVSTLAYLGATGAPGIVQLHDAGVQDGSQWFAMSLVEGPSLAHALEAFAGPLARRATDTLPVAPGLRAAADSAPARQPLALSRAQLLPPLRELALIVGTLHARGVVHGDLKPANVLLGVEGPPVLIDFGNARRIYGDDPDREAPFDTLRVYGTPTYMAPEQAHGRVDPRTDIYAFGCILYEVLWGQAFSGASRPLSTAAQALPDEATRALLEPWLDRLLESDSRRRPERLDDLIEDLDRFFVRGQRHTVARRVGWSPFVGRSQELALFERRLDRILAGGSSILGITAEAGMGRTRLANEMAARARTRGVEVVTHGPSDASPEDGGVWSRLTEGSAASRPLLLLLDDVHRLARPEQQRLLELKRKVNAAGSCLVLATWLQGGGFDGWGVDDTLTLSGFGRDATMEVGRSLLGGTPLSVDLLDLLFDYSAGNGARIRYLLGAWLRDGSIERGSDGSWVVGAASGRVAREVGQILAERGDALSITARAVLGVCCLLVDDFDRDELAWLVAPLHEQALHAALEELVEAGALARRETGLLRPLRLPQRPSDSDVHDYTRLARLYAAGCQWSEHSDPRHTANLAGLWAQASHHLRACQLFTLAAEAVRQRRDRYQARVWYRSALYEYSLCDQLEQGQLPDRLRDCHEGLAELLAAAGDYAAADRSFEAALGSVTAPEVRGRLLRKRGVAQSQARSYPAAEETFAVAARAVELVGGSERVELLLARFWHHYFSRREPEVLPPLLAVLQDAVAGASSAQRSEYHHCMAAWHQWQAGYTDDASAVEHARLAWDIVESDSALADRRGLSLFYLGFPLLWAGGRAAWPEAAAHLRASVAECGEVEQRSVACSAQLYFAVAMRRLGHVEETRRAAQDALSLALEVGSPGYRGAALACLGWVDYREGNLAGARQLARQAMQQWCEGALGYPFQWLARFPLAELQRLAGQSASARETLRRLMSGDQHRLTGATADAVAAACACADDAELGPLLLAVTRAASIASYL